VSHSAKQQRSERPDPCLAMPRYSQEVSTAFRELSWQPARPIIGSRQPSHGHPLSGVAECTECSHVNHSCLSSGKLEALGQ